MKITTLFLVLVSFNNCFSQHSVFVSDAETLVNNLLVGSGSINVQNIQFSGYDGALGGFRGPAQNVPYTFALAMTTGNVYSVQGPNNSPNAGGANNSSVNSSLSILYPGSLFNTAKLEFDFIPTGDTLKLEYIFGTEEVGGISSTLNDVFGIFLTANSTGTTQNIAKLPNNQNVSSNNLQFYTSYSIFNGSGNSSPYNTDQNFIQYNSLSIPLFAKSPVIPGDLYHLEIAIADGGDALFDSGVLIKASSLTAGIETVDLNALMTIYPNPTNDFVTIELPKELENCQLNLYNSAGSLVLSNQIINHTIISLSDLQKGIYTIELKSNSGVSYQKITKI